MLVHKYIHKQVFKAYKNGTRENDLFCQMQMTGHRDLKEASPQKTKRKQKSIRQPQWKADLFQTKSMSKYTCGDSVLEL